MKAFALVMCALVLGACSSMGEKVASGINNNQLKGTVGKSYSDVMYSHPDFGKVIGRERLTNGNEIMKLVGDFGTSTSDVGGIYGKKEQNARVTYFLVDSKGVIKDWATAFYHAGTAKCWVGVCGGTKNEQVPYEELDKIVKTSAGEPLDSWRAKS
jgi:hypothetical protein